VENAPLGNVNLVPSIVDAVEAKATVGEISNTLRKVFGEHTEIS
jgi:methylmalonyl-CoA mutase N-terminal domain/subunit